MISTVARVDRLIERQSPSKIIMVVTDLINKNCSWGLECRKELKSKAELLKVGDQVKVDFEGHVRVDDYLNVYNNGVVTKIERV